MNHKLLYQLNNDRHPVQIAGRKLKRNLRRGFKTPLTITICILLGLFLSFYSFYKVSKFYDKHKVNFKFPVEVKLHFPITISDRTKILPKNAHQSPKKADEINLPSVTPTPRLRSEKEIILSMKHGNVLWKIYGLETSYGKNDYCRNNGLGYGGFGVMHAGQIICYDSFAKATERAEYWLTNLGVDKNLVSALCMWNLGQQGLVNCVYYQHYLSM